jgi:DNA-binding NtrC family response regulator
MYKILVVDDEEKIRDILEKFLTKSGFEVIKATGGQEAIEILRSDIKLDLVVLDMKMPKVSGADVLQEMKNLNKMISVILLTGSIDAEKYFTSLKELDFKEENICYKPLDLFVLLDLVKKKLDIT